MSEKTAIVFGAGKIARGFIAHLLTLSGYQITFVEKASALVEALRERRRYKVRIMGSPEKDIVIAGFDALHADERDRIAAAIAGAGVVFVSIGGPNLPQIAPLLAAGIESARAAGRAEALNIILCENYFQPARRLREIISEQLGDASREWFAKNTGIVETMVLRSTIEPTEEMRAEDPLSLKAQNMWEMPADKQAFVGEIPAVLGLAPRENFKGGLVRKLFTYNAANAVISYLGYLKGYELLADAANDSELAELARTATRESSAALCRRYGFDPEEQQAFAEAAIAKYQKREIVDPIERNTRDPIRKLSRNDRLVGPACLAFDEGIRPVALIRGIAAALRYDYPGDEAARKLQAIIRDEGLGGALTQVCGIDPAGELAMMITEAYGDAERVPLQTGGRSNG